MTSVASVAGSVLWLELGLVVALLVGGMVRLREERG